MIYWTDEEELFMQENYKQLGAIGCGLALNKTRYACINKARVMKNKGIAFYDKRIGAKAINFASLVQSQLIQQK